MKAARSNIKNRHRKLQYRVTWGHLLYGQKLVPSGSYGHQETKTDDEILTCIHRKSIVCLCTKQSHSGKDAATPLLIYVFFFFIYHCLDAPQWLTWLNCHGPLLMGFPSKLRFLIAKAESDNFCKPHCPTQWFSTSSNFVPPLLPWKHSRISGNFWCVVESKGELLAFSG